MDGRISYSFKMDLKYKKYGRFIKNLLILIFLPFSKRHNRFYIYEDNVRVPFNKKWGCKLFNHRWKFYEQDSVYFCKDCYKFLNESEFLSEKRKKVLDDLGVK